MIKPIPYCTGCKRFATEIEEYLDAAEENEMDVNQYVREEEGTYNPANGHFLCTDCYIKAGMPSSRAGWVAP